MQINQVLEYFGDSQTKVAQALDIAQSNVARWVKSGEIPDLRQYQIQLLTKGKLKADVSRKPRKIRSDSGTKIPADA